MRGPFDRGWRRIICVASGPSLSAEQTALIRAECGAGRWRVFVANRTWETFPDADVLFAADRPFWNKYRADIAANFHGERWTGDQFAANKFGLRYVPMQRHPDGAGLSNDKTKIRHGGNSGHSLVALGHAFGMVECLLVAFDMQRTDGKIHHHGSHEGPLHDPTDDSLANWAKRFDLTARDLANAGVSVTNCSIATALRCFHRAPLEEMLAAEPVAV